MMLFASLHPLTIPRQLVELAQQRGKLLEMAEEKDPSLGCSGEASVLLQDLQSHLDDAGLCSQWER